MSAERGWIAEPPPPSRDAVPGEERKWRIMMGAAELLSMTKAVDHYHHSPCPVCGYATRYKHFGSIPCACVGNGGYQTKEAQEAHRRYAEDGTWEAKQHEPQ
jgi:hypothetical protein